MDLTIISNMCNKITINFPLPMASRYPKAQSKKGGSGRRQSSLEAIVHCSQGSAFTHRIQDSVLAAPPQECSHDRGLGQEGRREGMQQGQKGRIEGLWLTPWCQSSVS